MRSNAASCLILHPLGPATPCSPQASETYRVRADHSELQSRASGLEGHNWALREELDTLQTALAKLTLDWCGTTP